MGDPSIELYGGALDSEGRAVVVGTVEDEQSAKVVVRRCLENGKLDPEFDGDGQAIFGVPWDATARAMGGTPQIDPLGRIVIFGSTAKWAPTVYTYEDESVMFRVLPDGSLDRSFGDRGARRFESPVPGRLGGSIHLDSRGRVLITGAVSYPDANNVFLEHSTHAAVVRLADDGSPDPMFGDNGWWLYDFGSVDDWLVAELDSHDRIVGAYTAAARGYDRPGGRPHKVVGSTGLIRLDAEGRLDPTFGEGGLISLPPKYPDEFDIAAVTRLPNDRFLWRVRDTVVRYEADGAVGLAFTPHPSMLHWPWSWNIDGNGLTVISNEFSIDPVTGYETDVWIRLTRLLLDPSDVDVQLPGSASRRSDRFPAWFIASPTSSLGASDLLDRDREPEALLEAEML